LFPHNIISEYENYITKNPTGEFVSYAKDKIERLKYEQAELIRKNEEDNKRKEQERLKREEEERKRQEEYKIQREKEEQERKIKEQAILLNSDITKWKLGNKVCKEISNGIICASLMQWNEDKSTCMVKIVTSPGGTLDGENLTKDNLIWVATSGKGWHLCLDDEIQTSLANDNSQKVEVVNTPIQNNYTYKLDNTFTSLGYTYNDYTIYKNNSYYTKIRIQTYWNNGIYEANLYEGSSMLFLTSVKDGWAYFGPSNNKEVRNLSDLPNMLANYYIEKYCK